MQKPGVIITCILLSLLPVMVSLAQGQTPPANTPTVVPSIATSTSVSLTTTPTLSPTPTPGFWERTESAWVGFVGVFFGGLLAGAFGLWQLQKSLRVQRELEQEKQNRERELELQRQKWGLEKLQLEHQLELERMKREAEQEKQFRKLEAEEAAKQQAETQAEQARTVEEHATAYCRKLVNELCNLKILDMPSPLRLENVYVQVRVREEEPPHYVEEKEMKPLAEGEPMELLRRSQERLAERARVAMPPQEALVKFRRMSVLGDPGAGKTTLLRYVALQMSQRVWSNLPNLPIYVELRRFIDSGLGNLLDFAASDLAERYGFPDARSYLEQQLEAGEASLLLDGLDEVLGGASPQEAQEAYNRAAAEIGRLATHFPEAFVAVTCRRAGWRGGLTAFQTLEVLDFDWEQIQDFVGNWFKSAPSKAEGLRQALAGNLRMQTLAANPLILSLIAIVYEQELELPERRAELYNRCVEVLLREWDAKRNIKRFSQFTTDRKRDLLEEVAWHFHKAGRRYFPEAELLRLISEFLPTVNIPPQENKAILDEIAAQYGLLKVQAHGWYGFLHLTLQEYFAALAANERGTTGAREVVAHCHDPWWEEVILLLAGRMADASPLLLGLLGRLPGDSVPDDINELVPEGEPLTASDDLFHNDLLGAGRCLVGTPRVRMRGLRERITADVKQVLLTSPYRFDWQRAARVLVEIGGEELVGELLDMLIDDNIKPPERRSVIAEAFGESGDSSVAPSLLKLLETTGNLDASVRLSLVNTLAALKTTSAVPRLLAILRASEGDYRAQEQIARALGKLGNRSVVPDLLRLLHAAKKGDDDWPWQKCREGIVVALGLLGDKSVVPDLVAILKSEEIGSFGEPKGQIARALSLLGDQFIVPELIQILLSDRSLFCWGDDLVEAIIKLAGKSVSSLLLQILLDETTDPPGKCAVADALKDLRDASLTGVMVERFYDEKIPWQTRWLLTECLDDLQEKANGTLMKLLESRKIDKRVRIGIAATLGAWGIREGIPYLRQAIEDRIVPPSWQMGNFASIGRVWGRICRVLNSLGDDSVVPVLVRALNQSITRKYKGLRLTGRTMSRKTYYTAKGPPVIHSEPADELEGEAEAIIYAASVFEPEAIARRILGVLHGQASIDRPFLNRDDLIRGLPQLVSKPLIPDLLGLLAEHCRGDIGGPMWVWDPMVNTIAQMTDDIETIRAFLGMMATMPDKEQSDLSDTVYRAVYSISQRVKVRVNPDGQIHPIQAVS